VRCAARFIDTPRTLHVPGTFPDVQSAVDSLAGKLISAPVTIQLAEGTLVHRPIAISRCQFASMITVRARCMGLPVIAVVDADPWRPVSAGEVRTAA
jgi:hypothetical protein